MLHGLIPREAAPKDVSAEVQALLEREGVEVRLNATCIELTRHGDEEVGVRLDRTEGTPEVSGSHLLLAMGRTPNTDDLDLEKSGVACDDHGYILVDNQLRTNVPGIWALGDCNGRGGFTHTSYNDFEIVAANLLDHEPRSVTDRITAYSLYMVNRLLTSTSVEIRVNGAPNGDANVIRRRRGIGYVIQEVGLLPNLAVEQNVGLVPRADGWSGD
jgi:pyruvate/2-oxoglutarate dehydrogenase complex dihydrolipoamide dehydrogenase (E3) component